MTDALTKGGNTEMLSFLWVIMFLCVFRVKLLFVPTNRSDVAALIYKKHWVQKKN